MIREHGLSRAELIWTWRRVGLTRYSEEAGFYVPDGKKRGVVVRFYTWYGTAFQQEHYIRPEHLLMWRHDVPVRFWK